MSLFGTKATLHIEYASGEAYDVNFKQLHSVDMENGIETRDGGGYFGQTCYPTGLLTLKLKGYAETTVFTPSKKVVEKPAKVKQPNKPSVKTAAARVRKVTVAFQKLTKRIADYEQSLRAAKASQETLSADLKTAREQLLASAE